MRKYLLFCLLSTICFAQPAVVEITLTVSDNTGNSTPITLGLDKDATDGLDAQFGEESLPPLPPGYFSASIIGSDYSYKNIKHGNSDPFTGEVVYQIYFKGSASYNLNWSTPSNITTKIIDNFGGSIINQSFSAGSNSYSVPGAHTQINFILIFDNVKLPVELTEFKCASDANNVTLFWETATEVNNYGFEIERQLTEKEWEIIGFVEGHGNSNSPKSYSFKDLNIHTFEVKYRLKQIDIDGGFEYSDEIECKLELPKKTMLKQNYPNPFNPQTSIEFNLSINSSVKLNLYNSNGELIKSLVDKDMAAGYHKLTFDISSISNELASGVYYYQLITNEHLEVKKMLLLK